MKSILQSKEWAEFKKSQGFEIITLGEVFIHKRQLPFGRNFLYLPEVSADNISPSQIEELKKITKEQKSVFCRLELVDRFSENAYKMIQTFGFVKAFEQVQPKWRQIINLVSSEEEILSQMKSKGRYNIKVAEKHQVEIQKSPARNATQSVAGGNLKNQNDNSKIKIFHDLYSETVKRERITGRSLEYFENMVDSFKETDYLEIYVASYQGKPLAAAIVSFYDGIASYLYGGSSREHKEVMAPYLLHWQIMRDAKARGMKSYDLLGRSKPGDEKDRWAGVTRFKEQFGGEAVEILGSFDFVAQPTAYKIFKTAEKLRRSS